MSELFGKMEVKRGERCTNTVGIRHWTTPCCYADINEDEGEGNHDCPNCRAPVECRYETVEEAVCVIRDPDEEEET